VTPPPEEEPRPYAGPILVAPADHSVATDALEGAGVLSSLDEFSEAATRRDPDGSEIAAAGFGAGLDALGTVMDPLGSLASAGLGWLIEHVWFLHEPLDWLAGDPIQIEAQARTWQNMASALDALATDYRADVDGLAGWDGAAAVGYRQAATRYVDGLQQGAGGADDLSVQVLDTGAMVGTVRALIRDTVADFVAWLIGPALAALATSVISAGASVAAFIAWSVYRAVDTAAGVARRIAQLLDDLAAWAERLSSTVGKLDELAETLTRGSRQFAGGARRLDEAAAGTAEVARRSDDVAANPWTFPPDRGNLATGFGEHVGGAGSERWKQEEKAARIEREWERKVRAPE
jgi:hypothetical protein